MKNNQFRAHLDKYIKKRYKNIFALTIDKDSNTRVCYLYMCSTGKCIGSIVMYFTNEFMNISYSKDSKKVCKINNQKDSKEFDYCELMQAVLFIDKAVAYFVHN